MSDTAAGLPALNLFPPRPGYCHAAGCDARSTFVVRVRKITRQWTTGVDYCEQHAHEAAARMRQAFKVVVEPA